MFKKIIAVGFLLKRKFNIGNFVSDVYRDIIIFDSIPQRKLLIKRLKEDLNRDVKSWKRQPIIQIVFIIVVILLLIGIMTILVIATESFNDTKLMLIAIFFIFLMGIVLFVSSYIPIIKNKDKKIKEINIKLEIVNIYEENIEFSKSNKKTIISKLNDLKEKNDE